MSQAAEDVIDDWKGVDWEASVREASIAGSEVSYADMGSGEPAVLLVHGLGAQWRVWLPTLGPVSEQRRVIVPDLPGFGNSAMPEGKVSVEGFAEMLEELCESLGLGPVVAVGNSLGGCVTAQLALSHPERVERLVLVNAVGIVPSMGEWARSLPFIWAGATLGNPLSGARRQIASRAGLRKIALGRIVHEPELLDPDLVYHGILQPPGPGTRTAMAAGLSHLTPEWEDDLKGIHCPTLVIWGEEDRLLPTRHAETFLRRIEGSRLVTIERAGHIPMVEQPERFNEILLDFIESEQGRRIT